MVLNTEALYAACRAVAEQTLWKTTREKKTTKKEIEALTERFYTSTIVHLDFIIEQHRDPNLLVRAVRYLAHTHALPPMGKDSK
ncbi:MAG: hypothetical protein ACRD3W_01875, partial [Terriglobales bacterium]